MKEPTLTGIFSRFVVVIVIQYIALRIVAHAKLMEHLLAPGAGSFWPLAASLSFLTLRLVTFVFGPSWLIWKLWNYAMRHTPRDSSSR